MRGWRRGRVKSSGSCQQRKQGSGWRLGRLHTEKGAQLRWGVALKEVGGFPALTMFSVRPLGQP